MKVRECAFNHNYKLYRTGEFFDLKHDPDEKNPLQSGSLDDTGAAALRNLQAVLVKFKDARPMELDRQFEESADGRKPAGRKKVE